MSTILKRFIILILILVFLCAIFAMNKSNLFKKLEVNNALVYTSEKLNFESVKTGYGNCYKLNESQIKNLKNIDGLEFESQLEIEEIIKRLNISVLSKQLLDGKTIIYGSTSYGNKSVEIDGKKINIQLCYDGNCVKIGMPLLLGSY